MSEHGAVDEHFFVPAHEVADERAQGWVLEEFSVSGRCVSDVEEFEGLGFGRAANTLMEEGIVCRVKGAVTRGAVRFEYSGMGELGKVASDGMVSKSGVLIHETKRLTTVLAYRGRPLVG